MAKKFKKPKREPADVGRAISTFIKHAPPQVIESEMAVIGGMILDSRIIPDVMQVIKDEDDFFHIKHGVLYKCLVEIWDSGKPPEVIHIKNWLHDRGMLEQVGGIDYLMELAESVPSAATAVFHAKEIAQKKQTRDLVDAFSVGMLACFDGTRKPDDVIDEAETTIMQIGMRNMKATHDDMGSILQDVYDQLEAAEDQAYTGIQSGLRDLDDITSGFQDGNMIILAARPSMGKTALATTILDHIAVNCRIPAGFFSMEMSKSDIGKRLLCGRAGVDSRKLMRNMLSADDFTALANAVGELSDAPLIIDDTPGLTPIKMRGIARRMVSKHGVKIIFIDYLQLMTGGEGDSRQEIVSDISRNVKALAMQLMVPIVVLCQLNRAAEIREGHRPRMSDLRESGSLEQDADVVMLLHREEYYHVNDANWIIDNPDKSGLSEIIIAKQRNGPTGIVMSQFDPKTMRFHDRAQGALSFGTRLG